MKFAFSTVACPKWDFETIASRAKEYGYDGVEIRGFLDESILTASNVFLTDPKKLRAMFKYHGLEVACLSSSIAFHQHRKRDAAAIEQARQFIDTASELGCGFVKLFDTEVRPGQSRGAAAVAMGDWLLPLGDYAAERNVVIVVENALSFRNSKEMWMMLDRISHPSIACCWDLFNASQIGEDPSVSVPTLNSKIQYTQVKDAAIGPLGANYAKLGEGTVPVRKFIIRLKGIGYESWVSFEWEKAWLPGIAEPEEVLPDAIKKLRDWAKPQGEEEGDAKPEAKGTAKAAHAAPAKAAAH
jgi:sugar phosphate isomerase/epimerase